MTRVFVSLGSNIDPRGNLQEAVARLKSRCAVRAVSPVYESRSVGSTPSPNFLNAAVLLETDQSAEELRELLREIEAEMERVRTSDKNAARTIDLDIVLFGDQVVYSAGKRIPPHELLIHAHVAGPVADLAPDVCHPEDGRTLREIADLLPSSGLWPRPDVQIWVSEEQPKGRQQHSQ